MKREKNSMQDKAFNCSDYKQLFDLLYEPLCQYCYRFVLSTEVTEDIVQDTFAYLWENWNRLSQIKSLKSYLYTTVKNRSLKYLKKQYSKIPFVKIEDSIADFIDVEQPSADELLEYKDLNKIVEIALSKLPERCRTIFVLKRFDEKTNKEIADLLNISVKTVEGQMTIAIKRLTEIVNRQWGNATLILLNICLSDISKRVRTKQKFSFSKV